MLCLIKYITYWFDQLCSDNLKKKKKKKGVPVVAQWLTNQTKNREVVGLIPGLDQWVKDLALP